MTPSRACSDFASSDEPSLLLMQFCQAGQAIEYGAIKEHRYVFMKHAYSSLLEGNLNGIRVIIKAWRGVDPGLRSGENFVKRVSEALKGWMNIAHCKNVANVLGLAPGFDRLPALVMPQYQNGNISHYLQNNPQASATTLLRGVASGLNYMHSQIPPIIHGRIRAANILVSNTGDACLTDIGMSSVLLPEHFEVTMNSAEDARWTAPEVMQDEEGPQLHRAADVYSFGMTMLEVYSGEIPYAHIRNPNLVLIAVINGVRPTRDACADVSDDVWKVMEHCWVPERDRRPGMDVILNSLTRAFE